MDKNTRYKEVFNKLNNKINNSYNGKKLNINTYIRLGLLAKYTKSLKAIYILDKNGFYEDCKILSRTVFEIFLTIMYCELNPTKLYKRFFDYNVHTRLKYTNFEDKDISEVINFVYRDNIEKMKLEKEKFKTNYKEENLSNWHGMTIKQLCKKLNKKYKKDFFTTMYYVIYMNFSEYIHPDIVNIFGNYISIDKRLNVNCKAVIDKDNSEIIEIIEGINDELTSIQFC